MFDWKPSEGAEFFRRLNANSAAFLKISGG
jgi:hypothetical protein